MSALRVRGTGYFEQSPYRGMFGALRDRVEVLLLHVCLAAPVTAASFASSRRTGPTC